MKIINEMSAIDKIIEFSRKLPNEQGIELLALMSEYVTEFYDSTNKFQETIDERAVIPHEAQITSDNYNIGGAPYERNVTALHDAC